MDLFLSPILTWKVDAVFGQTTSKVFSEKMSVQGSGNFQKEASVSSEQAVLESLRDLI